MNSSLTKAQTSVTSFGSVGTTAMAGVGVAIAAVGVASIKAASDLNESLNKARVVFDGASSSVIRFSETTAESFGIAQSAALDAAAGFGAMAQSAGVSEQASATMSIRLVKLAADMASFNNQDPSEMLERLRSGLAGEAEPLRKFGVFISEARVEQEALALGIAKTGDELTDAQKIQARYNIILKDTTKQSGDFSRTIGESLPNQLRVLKARFTDLAASIGKDLLPVAVQLLTTLQDIIDIVKALGGPIGDTRNTAAELGGTLGKLGSEEAQQATKGLLDLDGALERTSQSLGRQQTSVFQTTQTYTDMDGKVHTLLLTYERLTDGGTRLVSSVEQTGEAIEKTGKAVEDAAKKSRHFGDVFGGIGKDIAASLKEDFPSIVGTVTKWKDVFTLSASELEKITQSWVEIGRTMARDLRKIADSDLTPAMKQAIAALPPEMRHAWAEGNDAQRQNIQSDVKRAYNLEQTINQLANQARDGFKQVGAAMMDGTRLGITTRSETIAVAAAQAVHNAIERAKKEAGAHSPSEVMRQLGQDLMEGLKNGIDDKDRELVQKIIDSIGKMLDAAKGALSDFRSKMQGFAGGISGGFSSFADLVGGFGAAQEGGGDIQSLLASQLSGARNFADILKALQTQGASKALLSQIAGAGPEGIPFAQALLQGGPELVQQASQQLEAINRIADHTGKTLSQEFFGEQMERLRNRVDRVGDLLAEANRLQTGKGGDVVLQIDGQTFARITRDQLNKLADRNVSAGIR